MLEENLRLGEPDANLFSLSSHKEERAGAINAYRYAVGHLDNAGEQGRRRNSSRVHPARMVVRDSVHD